MKALITGSLGFVGKYLRSELEQNGYDVIGLDLQEAEKTIKTDLLNPSQILDTINQIKPDAIFHLAAQADVGKSWRQPALTMELNLVAAANLLEATRDAAPDARLVMVGSSDQYGNLGPAGENVTEDIETRPQSPYAISKKAQEELSKLYTKIYGMKICMTRSFNHGGAGQRTGFMIPDFASGIVSIERGEQQELLVGNLTSRRDFTHVKDIVRAYRLIAEKGIPGEVYNVGSGQTYSAQEILDQLISMAKCDIPVRQDPSRMRPSDTPIIRCNYDKLSKTTNWKPRLGIKDILLDVMEYYRYNEK